MTKKIDLRGLILSDEEKAEIESCPHEIVDINKFIKHLKAKAQVERMKKYVASDGTEINLSTPANRLKTQIEHLSGAEKKKITAKSNTVNSFSTKSRNFLKSAIGGYETGVIKTAQSNHEKLLTERKAELLEYFGRFFSIDEVHTITRKDWGTSIMTKEQLSLFCKDNHDEIERLKDKHKESFEHLRLVHKSSRLEELTQLYNKLKVRYEKTNSREDHRVLLQTIESIRKEVEVDKLIIEASIDHTIQEEVNSQIRNGLMREIPLREIIIGRLAARIGITPRELVHDMSQSYYARMNRLIADADDVDFEEIGFPSEATYDFEHIEKLNVEKKHKDEQKQKQRDAEQVIKDSNREKNEVLKTALLEKLKNKTTESKRNQDELRKRLM